MSIVLQPLEQLDLPKRLMPDAYTSQGKLINLPSNFVISRKKDGEVLSCYGDNRWNLTPYKSNPKHTALISFDKINDISIIVEAKRLMFLIMVMGIGRGGSSLSTNTLITHYFHQAILPVALFAQSKKRSLSGVLSNNKLIKEFADSFVSNKSWLRPFSSFLSILDQVNNDESGISYNFDKELQEYLWHQNRKIRNTTSKQTEIIPTRILSESIHQRWEQIKEIESMLPALLEFANNIIESKHFALSIASYKKSKRSECSLWSDVVKEYGLESFFDKYQVKTRQQFRRFIKQLQGTCKHLIHAYTGMRDMEAISLTTDCFESINLDGRRIVRLIGITTKLEGRQCTTKWATTKELERVINLLTSFSVLIRKHVDTADVSLPLFISSKLFSPVLNETKKLKFSYQFQAKDQLPLDWERLKINKDDLKELKEIEIFREWDSEDRFQVGEPWYFKSHQYRRSLVVYAIQSGLVSLGSLQIQLKHLFKEMTLYYGNGAASAKKLFAIDENHIANTMNTIKPEIDALSYIKQVILTDEKLYGAHGQFIEKRIKPSLQNSIFTLEDKLNSIKRFRKGEIAYKDTSLGSCITLTPCESRLMGSIIACMSCDSAVHTIKKIDSVIQIQEEFLELLDKSSVEYRSEVKDLEILIDYRDKIKKEEHEHSIE